MNDPVNILLVDDMSANLDALEAILDFPDCRLVRATSGHEALVALLEREFAVIVLDMRMPDINGLDLAKLIKQRPRTLHVPIVFLTAHMIEETDILRGYGAGAVDYLSKPINPGILRSKIGVFVDLFRKTCALASANLALEREMMERERVQQKLREVNLELEGRVQERTAELTRLNQILHKNAERLRLAITGAGMATWDADPTTGSAIWSNTLFNMMGYEQHPAGEASIDLWIERIHPEDREHVLGAIERARQTGDLYSVEHRIIRADDRRVVWVLPFGRFLYDTTGHATRFVGVCFDNTLRRTSEEALKEADRRKDEFLAMLSHELRNPLWPIVNALAVLRMPAGLPDAKRESLAVIDRQVRKLTQILEDLLDVSRITSGKVTLKRTTVDVSSIVEAAIETARAQIEAKRHSIVRELPSTSVSLVADPTRLEQVLSNLITNAAKYTEAGGRIFVTVKHDDTHVEFRVRDTGIGIPSEKLPNIFDLFYQVDTTLDRATGGLGIGLTLVRKLVDLHGGTVTAASEGPGRGSEFVVRLPRDGGAPVRLEAPPVVREVSSEHQWSAAPLRILVVEDAEDSRLLVKMILEMQGHEVAIACDGVEALNKLGAFRPQVALVDIGLPGMSGYDVAREIRLRHGNDILMIAMTGYGDRQSRQRSSEAGFDQHLVKPVDPMELTSMLMQANV